MDWSRGSRADAGDWAFASKLMRLMLPTSVHRRRHCRTEGGASVIDKYGWRGGPSGQYVEMLVEAEHGAVWKPAVIHTRASWSSDVVEVECDGERRVVHVATMRDGRWVPHTMECVFGDTLEEQGWVIADLLTHGLGRTCNSSRRR